MRYLTLFFSFLCVEAVQSAHFKLTYEHLCSNSKIGLHTKDVPFYLHEEIFKLHLKVINALAHQNKTFIEPS